jgi:hypothetical protein
MIPHYAAAPKLSTFGADWSEQQRQYRGPFRKRIAEYVKPLKTPVVAPTPQNGSLS